MKNLFDVVSEFNARYDKLNDCLIGANNGTIETKIIADYLNICSEEYYFYKTGLVPKDVWQNWAIGMKEKFEIEEIKTYAINEFKSNTKEYYYGFDPYKLRLLV